MRVGQTLASYGRNHRFWACTLRLTCLVNPASSSIRPCQWKSEAKIGRSTTMTPNSNNSSHTIDTKSCIYHLGNSMCLRLFHSQHANTDLSHQLRHRESVAAVLAHRVAQDTVGAARCRPQSDVKLAPARSRVAPTTSSTTSGAFATGYLLVPSSCSDLLMKCCTRGCANLCGLMPLAYCFRAVSAARSTAASRVPSSSACAGDTVRALASMDDSTTPLGIVILRTTHVSFSQAARYFARSRAAHAG